MMQVGMDWSQHSWWLLTAVRVWRPHIHRARLDSGFTNTLNT